MTTELVEISENCIHSGCSQASQPVILEVDEENLIPWHSCIQQFTDKLVHKESLAGTAWSDHGQYVIQFFQFHRSGIARDKRGKFSL